MYLCRGGNSSVEDSINNITVLPFMGVINGNTSAGVSSTSIDISKLVFDNWNPLYLVLIYRSASSHNNDGTAIIKKNSSNVCITNKSGAALLTDVSYDSTTENLTITCGDYMSIQVYGKLKSI